jgi:hypothetical protein
LVDANRGTKFPATTLMSFRDLHERKIAREIGNIHTRFGWIREVLVEEGKPFASGSRFEFAKTTLLVGRNVSGKRHYVIGLRVFSSLNIFSVGSLLLELTV